MSDSDEPREAFIARMVDEGFVVDLPKSDELFIDIDTDEEFARFETAHEMLCRNIQKHLDYAVTASKSGLPRRHIRMRMPFDLDPWQRIAWQASLGSDYRRELLSCVRASRGDAHPSLFVERPEPQPEPRQP